MAYTKTSFVCLLLLLYMGVFYFSHKHLPVRSAKLFNGYYFSALTVVLFDFITLCTVNRMDIIPPIINLIAHIIYMLAINVMLYFMFVYEQSLLGNHIKLTKTKRVLQTLPMAITSFLILILPLGYVEGKYTNYSMGPKVYGLYGCAILYNIFLLYYGIRYTKYLPKEKRTAMLASVPFFFIVTIVSIVFPESLCIIVYVILSAVGLLMSSENMEKYIDKQTGMFNQYALGIVIREFMENKNHKVATIISLSEPDTQNTVTDWRSYIDTLATLQRFCSEECKRQPYRIGDNGFVILASSKENAKDCASKIISYTNQHCNNIHAEYSIVSLADYTDSDDYMSHMIDFCIDAISKSANFDFLTGTRNRNSFEKFLTQLRNDKADVYYFVSDVNNLKDTNDVLGHAAGDELIQTVAKLLCDTVKDNGWVFRQGGDEFAVLWKGSDAEAFLELLYHKTKVMNKSRNIPVSFATGYGKILDSNGMENADKMMYENKAKMKANKKKK